MADSDSVQSIRADHLDDTQLDQRVIVVVAGPAGLNAARHLQRHGYSVIVLQARNNIGDCSSLSVPVDIGAGFITGIEADVATERRADPYSLLCAQLGSSVLNRDCPFYDVTGVPTDLDETFKAEHNSLLDDMVLLVAENSQVTDRGEDPFSYGACSCVAIGTSGEHYDTLCRPVDNCMLVDGEATCKGHPDTVGGAMMAVLIMDILKTGNDYASRAKSLEAAQRHTAFERIEVGDIEKRLDEVELSCVLHKNSFEQARILSRDALLQYLFSGGKIIAGRLHLAKELFTLSPQVLKYFTGTNEGLKLLDLCLLPEDDVVRKHGTIVVASECNNGKTILMLGDTRVAHEPIKPGDRRVPPLVHTDKRKLYVYGDLVFGLSGDEPYLFIIARGWVLSNYQNYSIDAAAPLLLAHMNERQAKFRREKNKYAEKIADFLLVGFNKEKEAKIYRISKFKEPQNYKMMCCPHKANIGSGSSYAETKLRLIKAEDDTEVAYNLCVQAIIEAMFSNPTYCGGWIDFVKLEAGSQPVLKEKQESKDKVDRMLEARAAEQGSVLSGRPHT